MKVALLKPNYGSHGGFERLLADLEASLRAAGDDVRHVGFDTDVDGSDDLGVRISPGVRAAHDSYFRYLTLVHRMDELELDEFDVVVASQPPTYLVDHPRVVTVFYHQAREFYDLADLAVSSGVFEADLHRAATREVRRLDRSRVGNVVTWLAGSDEVAARLRDFWGIDPSRIRPFRAAPSAPSRASAPYDPTGPAVCVSRHEWPKRTELVVQAAHLDPDGRYELVGGGSRIGWVRSLDERFARDRSAAEDDDPGRTWRNAGARIIGPEHRADDGAANLTILGETTDARRDDAYDGASVVIAPAYREDYGLTVLEAFRWGRPAIVCDDGGGLVELVADTGGAMIVEPTASAIAEAVRQLRADPGRTAGMAEAALAAGSAIDEGAAVDALRRAVRDAATATTGTVRPGGDRYRDRP